MRLNPLVVKEVAIYADRLNRKFRMIVNGSSTAKEAQIELALNSKLLPSGALLEQKNKYFSLSLDDLFVKYWWSQRWRWEIEY